MPASPLCSFKKNAKLLAWLGLGCYAIENIRSIKAGDKNAAAFDLQLFDDLVARRDIGVAVRARRGTPGNSSSSKASCRYSGRKSCPHCETQWASIDGEKGKGRFFLKGKRAGHQKPFGRVFKSKKIPIC